MGTRAVNRQIVLLALPLRCLHVTAQICVYWKQMQRSALITSIHRCEMYGCSVPAEHMYHTSKGRWYRHRYQKTGSSSQLIFQQKGALGIYTPKGLYVYSHVCSSHSLLLSDLRDLAAPFFLLYYASCLPTWSYGNVSWNIPVMRPLLKILSNLYYVNTIN